MKKTAKKSTVYKNNYNTENYDSLRIVVPKGDKAKIEHAAKSAGESINGYVGKAIKQRMMYENAPE